MKLLAIPFLGAAVLFVSTSMLFAIDPVDDTRIREIEAQISRPAIHASEAAFAARVAASIGTGVAAEGEVADALATAPEMGTDASASEARLLTALLGVGGRTPSERLANWGMPAGLTRPMLLRYGSFIVGEIDREMKTGPIRNEAIVLQLQRLEVVKRALAKLAR